MFGSSESEISAAYPHRADQPPSSAQPPDYKYGVTREAAHGAAIAAAETTASPAASSSLSTAQTPLPSTGSLSIQAGPPGEGRSGQTRRSGVGGGTAREHGGTSAESCSSWGNEACQPLRCRERRRQRERLARKRANSTEEPFAFWRWSGQRPDWLRLARRQAARICGGDSKALLGRA